MDNNYNFIIPDDVKIILAELTDNGFESYVVGGCVRDSFIEGRQVNDWDICTNAKPDQVLEVFKNYNVIQTGLQHGTVTVVYNSENYEITTYRVDGEYVDNRRPKNVNFVSELAEDLKRRDFTINALAYNNQGLKDFNDGIADINQKIVRCVGDAYTRFDEDALRILRALRFGSVLGFTIELETRKAIYDLKDNLKNISNERIMVEFYKLITGINAIEILREFSEVIAVFIPEIQDMFGFEQNNQHHKYDVWEHTLKAIEYIPLNHKNCLILRLAAFFHDIGKPQTYTQDGNGVGHFYEHAPVSKDITTNILTRLKSSKDMINRVCMLVENHDRQLTDTRKNVLRFLNKFNIEFLNDYITLRQADIKAQGNLIGDRLEVLDNISDIAIELINENACYKTSQLKINGKDLIKLGVPQGKKIGEILSDLMTEVLDEKLENDKDILINRVKMLLQT